MYECQMITFWFLRSGQQWVSKIVWEIPVRGIPTHAMRRRGRGSPLTPPSPRPYRIPDKKIKTPELSGHRPHEYELTSNLWLLEVAQQTHPINNVELRDNEKQKGRTETLKTPHTANVINALHNQLGSGMQTPVQQPTALLQAD